jgi:hypothetical protein
MTGNYWDKMFSLPLEHDKKRFAILVTCHVPKAVKTFCKTGYLSCSKGSENVLPY